MSPVHAGVERNSKSVAVRNSLKLPFLTSILLAASFPRWNFYWLAWIALAPLLIELRRAKTARHAFWLGSFSGFFFFLLSIHWLRHVTLFGLLVACVVQSLFFGLFSMAARLALVEREKLSQLLVSVPAVSSAWVLMEWIRSEIPVIGFGWNLLAYSQAENVLAIQSANIFGAYGVSFLMAWVNTVVGFMLVNRRLASRCVATALGFVPMAANFYYGGMEMRSQAMGPVVKVAVVQGNIAQDIKWTPGMKEVIIEKYMKLTELTSFDGPDVVLWPESAYPGFFNEDYGTSLIPPLVKRLGFPLLMGSPHRERQGLYYNSAYLLSGDGAIVERHDKLHLVPFGEYVPFKPWLSFLERYAYSLGVGDFSAGNVYTVFKVPVGKAGETVRLSVLICFEDIFPDLARRFVLEGAQCLVVLTNDAWFGKTGEPFQHLQTSVFRAVENGVPLIRAGNIGVSAFIDPRGQVEDRVKNEKGFETYVTGALTRPVPFVEGKTFYQKAGYAFPWLCVAGMFGFAMYSLVEKRKVSL